MTDALYTLAAWLSPAFPIGSFSYSHGLEGAIRDGRVTDARTLEAWIADTLEHGAGRTDAILLAAAYHAPDDTSLAELAESLQPTRERHLEAMAQGQAFAATVQAAWKSETETPETGPVAYPVAVGRAAAAHDLPLPDTVLMYLHAFTGNLVSVGIRAIPIGQNEGQTILAALKPVTIRVANQALSAPIDDLGSATLMGDIMSMRHETQAPRLFRS